MLYNEQKNIKHNSGEVSMLDVLELFKCDLGYTKSIIYADRRWLMCCQNEVIFLPSLYIFIILIRRYK